MFEASEEEGKLNPEEGQEVWRLLNVDLNRTEPGIDKSHAARYDGRTRTSFTELPMAQEYVRAIVEPELAET